MSHLHGVYDTDAHFIIDIGSRKIINQTTKDGLIQNDHNSERFTFEMPQSVDGHDMSLCSKVEIHYINISTDGKNKSAGVYLVDDLAISSTLNDSVIFSWLVSANATQYAGTLNFLVRFTCLTDDVIDYAWHTDVYDEIKIKGGMNNGEAVVAEFPDVLEAWKREIFADFDSAYATIDEKKADAVNAIDDAHENAMSEIADAKEAAVKELTEYAPDLAPPDLAENDPNAAGYVKNRTHYSELVDAVLFPEQTITIANNQCMKLGLMGLVVGETYTVVWNGTTYTCVAEEWNIYGNSSVAIGNPAFTGGENNNMPFGAADVIAQGASGFMAMVDGDYTVSITGKKEIIHQLPAKYSNEFRVNVVKDSTGFLVATNTVDELEAAINAGKRLYLIIENHYTSTSSPDYRKMVWQRFELHYAEVEQPEGTSVFVFMGDSINEEKDTWRRAMIMLGKTVGGATLQGLPVYVSSKTIG